MEQLGEIPLGSEVVETDRTISLFFRLLWEQLRGMVGIVATKASIALTNQSAAIGTSSAYVTTAAGLYRVSWYFRKTTIDGVSSSLTFTLGWTDHVQPLTESGAAVATDAVTAQQSGSKLVYADANSDLTYAMSYSSNTPAAMRYELYVSVEQFG